MSKDFGTRTLSVRRVGNMFYDRGFADLLLRYLLQSGSRVASFLIRFQRDIQLRGCVLGQMLPENAKTIWSVVEDVLKCPDVIAWRQALIDKLYHVLSVDGTTKIAMGLRRSGTMIPRREEGVVDNVVDHNTCILTIRTPEGGLLGLAVVPNDSKPWYVIAALESAIREAQRSSVHLLVVDSASAALYSAMLRSLPALLGIALDTCHLPMKYESVASNRKSPGSLMLRRLVSKFNVELPEGSPPDLYIPFNGNVAHKMDELEQYFHDHLCT